MYASVADFTKAFGEFETDELAAIDQRHHTEDKSRIQFELDNAGSEINSIIAGRIKFPIDVIVPYLRYAELRIARSNLDSNEERDKVKYDRDEVIKRLESIANGESVLLDQNGDPVPVVDNPTGNTGTTVNQRMYSGDRSVGVYVPDFGFYGQRNPYFEGERWINR